MLFLDVTDVLDGAFPEKIDRKLVGFNKKAALGRLQDVVVGFQSDQAAIRGEISLPGCSGERTPAPERFKRPV